VRPPLDVFFIGLEREGFERAGDDARRAVIQAVRDDLMATLARAGTFSAVSAVGSTCARPTRGRGRPTTS
jgi:hypothetical protein